MLVSVYLSFGIKNCLYFFIIWPILEARAEILSIFRCFFGKFSDTSIFFWNYLTFSPNLYISKFQFSHHKPTKIKYSNVGMVRCHKVNSALLWLRKKRGDLNRGAMFNTFIFPPPRKYFEVVINRKLSKAQHKSL